MSGNEWDPPQTEPAFDEDDVAIASLVMMGSVRAGVGAFALTAVSILLCCLPFGVLGAVADIAALLGIAGGLFTLWRVFTMDGELRKATPTHLTLIAVSFAVAAIGVGALILALELLGTLAVSRY